MAPQIFKLAQVPVTCHAFNTDRSRRAKCSLSLKYLSLTSLIGLAVSLNSNDVQILANDGTSYVPTDNLAQVYTA